MNLSGNYVGRSGTFSYCNFTKDALVALKGESTNADGLLRIAVDHGAVEKSNAALRKGLREGLSSAAAGKGFKRHRIQGKEGYFFSANC